MIARESRSVCPAVVRWGCLWLLSLSGCGGNQDWTSTIADHPDLVASRPAPGLPTVGDGFHGERHPLLAADCKVPVTAHWESFQRGRAFSLSYFPLEYYTPFAQLQVRQPSRVYTAEHLSAFMPSEPQVPHIGSLWKLDMRRVEQFLTQFHPAVSTHLNSIGRMPGPNGGFGMLRAVSSTHYEVAFRIHAEIEPEPGLFYTPSHFKGHLLISRSGQVEEFHLAIPTDEALNVTLTVALESEALLDIVKVERMELVSAAEMTDRSPWSKEIAWPDAERRLKELFYEFMEIAWVPPEEALDRARQQERPIFAVVLWGGLDAQSC